VVLVAWVIASIADVGGSAARLTLIGLLALAMGRPKRRGTPVGRTRPNHHGAHLDRHRPSRRQHTRSVRTRRLISILAMLVGALTGGVLLRWVAPLWLAAVLLVACATGAYLPARRLQSQAWR
jgi:uncharacterized membrane protein YoaK (UPF0700 family)